jgi:hypothetical protein
VVPLDLLDTLKQTWQTIGAQYDVTGELPDMGTLFEGVDLDSARHASERVVANMLSEIMERIGRFSPWYKQPAKAFGLEMTLDDTTRCAEWRLSPQAVRQWQPLLGDLAIAIEKNVGLILSANWLDSLEARTPADDPCVAASCLCTPPRVILVHRSVLTYAEIRCDTCHAAFHVIEDSPYENDWFD